jgi:transcription elongation factor Elf1
LKASGNSARFASHIRSFEDGHPEFAALPSVADIHASDPGTIKLNHAIHMKPIRRGPNGPTVQLECGNCHRATSVDADLTYADPKYRAAAASYSESDETLLVRADTLMPPKPMSGRELMAPVKFANACAACHLLTFDKRFDEGVPHDKPEVIHAFLVRAFREYVAAHPTEVRVQRDPSRDLTGKPLPPAVRILTAAQWVTERTAEAEDLLWRKTCKQCHTLTPFARTLHRQIEWPAAGGRDTDKLSGISVELPSIARAKTTLRWMPHAKFDHGAHEGFTCVNCHAKALTSTEAGDILLPGLATCQTCHAPGPEHAESGCFECHTYHDWSKRKEGTPKFTLPALRTSSR